MVGAPVAAAVLVAAGLAATTDITTDSAPPPSGPDSTSNALASSPGGGTSLLYRSCEDDCSISLITNAGATTVDLATDHPQLAANLAEDGLDGVTLSYDGSWLGAPDGTGFTLHDLQADDADDTIDLPAGPSGTHWQPYYWIWDLGLVLAQWEGDDVVQYAIVNSGSIAGFPEVELVEAPEHPTLVPAFSHLDWLGLVKAVDVGAAPADRAPVPTLATWKLPTAPGSELVPPSDRWNMTGCLRPGETLAGYDGAPVQFMTDTSSDSLPSTVVFGMEDGKLVASGIVRGACQDGDDTAPDAYSRYDLPLSIGDDVWTLLGPIPHQHGNQAALMSHRRPDSQVTQLVAVGYYGERTAVAELPADAQIVMSGMTDGQLAQ